MHHLEGKKDDDLCSNKVKLGILFLSLHLVNK